VNKQVLTHGGLGIKHIAAKPATEARPFHLSSGVHHQDASSASDLDTTDNVFRAKPAPKNILTHVVVSQM